MPCVTTFAVMSCMHHMAHACRQASHPYVKCGMSGITYGHAIRTRQTIFKKINHLTYYHPKYENCKPEHAENDSDCHAQ